MLLFLGISIRSQYKKEWRVSFPRALANPKPSGPDRLVTKCPGYDRMLFDMIRTEMPPLRFRTPETKPLPDNVYVDIISYIFKTNAFPAGKTELTSEDLDKVQILGRNGVEPPPQFSLVLTVGCMTYRRVSWTISSATEPVRATMPDISTKEEVAAAKTKLLGLREFRLADFGYLGRGFSAEALEGHRILVKGYIIRQREFDRVSVTSVSDVAPDCE